MALSTPPPPSPPPPPPPVLPAYPLAGPVSAPPALLPAPVEPVMPVVYTDLSSMTDALDSMARVLGSIVNSWLLCLSF